MEKVYGFADKGRVYIVAAKSNIVYDNIPNRIRENNLLATKTKPIEHFFNNDLIDFNESIYVFKFDNDDDKNNIINRMKIILSPIDVLVEMQNKMISTDHTEETDNRTIGEIMTEDHGITEMNDPYDKRPPSEKLEDLRGRKAQAALDKTGEHPWNDRSNETLETIVKYDNRSADDYTGLLEKDWYFVINVDKSKNELLPVFTICTMPEWEMKHTMPIAVNQALGIKKLLDNNWEIIDNNTIKYVSEKENHLSIMQRAAAAELRLLNLGFVQNDELITSVMLVSKQEMEAVIKNIRNILTNSKISEGEIDDLLAGVDTVKTTQLEKNKLAEKITGFLNDRAKLNPGQISWALDEKLTKSSGFVGKDIPVFQIKITVDPNNVLQTTEVSPVMQFFKDQPQFSIAAGNYLVYYNDALKGDPSKMIDRAKNIFNDIGFIEDQSLITEKTLTEFFLEEKVKDVDTLVPVFPVDLDRKMVGNSDLVNPVKGRNNEITKHNTDEKLKRGIYGRHAPVIQPSSNMKLLEIAEWPDNIKELYLTNFLKTSSSVWYGDFTGEIIDEQYILPLPENAYLEGEDCINIKEVGYSTFFGARSYRFSLFNKAQDGYITASVDEKSMIIRIHTELGGNN